MPHTMTPTTSNWYPIIPLYSGFGLFDNPYIYGKIVIKFHDMVDIALFDRLQQGGAPQF